MNTTLQKFSVRIAKFKAKHPQFASNLYIIALVIFITANIIKNSKMTQIISQRDIFILEAVPAALVTLKVLFLDDYDWKELGIFLMMECYLYMSSYIVASVEIFYLSFFIWGAKNVNVKKILKAFIIVNLVIMAIAAVLAMTGVILNFTTTRDYYSPVLRYSMGMVYPTDYAARGLSILLAYAVLKEFKLRLPEYISFIAVIFWFYLITGTRVDLVLSIFLLVLLIGYPLMTKVITKLGPKIVTILMYCYMAIIFLIGFLYKICPTNKILDLINHALSGRLTNESILLKHYSVTFHGQYIYQPGGGGGFYIDSAFFRTLWMYGIPMLAIFIVMIYFLNRRFILNPQFLPFELAFIVFFISAGIDQHFWDASFNFIPLMLVADLHFRQTQKS